MNDIIFLSLDLLRLINEKCSLDLIERNDNGVFDYTDIKKFVSKKISLCNENVFLRKRFVEYIEALSFDDISEVVFYIENNKKTDDYNKELDSISSIENLSWDTLSKIISKTFDCITFTQFDKYILLKYNKTAPSFYWNSFSNSCRGKVVDIFERKIVVYPFDKFFNLNESKESSFLNVESKILNSAVTFASDKKDGSLIAVTNLDGFVLINTNGSINNPEVNDAKKILSDKYSKFYNNVPSGYTFIFELISDKYNRVVDYGNEVDLYLIGIRELNTFKLLSYDKVDYYSDEYGLPVPERKIINISDLNEMILFARTKDVNKEGWVIRSIDKDGNDFMFKLKLSSYFIKSRDKATTTICDVYKMFYAGTLQEYINDNPADEESILSFLEEIKIINRDYSAKVVSYVENKLSSLGLSLNECRDDNEKMVLAIKSVTSGYAYSSQAIKYLKGMSDNDNLFYRCSIKLFNSLI